MPKIALELTDYYTTVSRPVNIAIATQIAKRLGLDPEIKPEMSGLNEFFLVRGSDISSDGATNITPGTERVQISITEEYADSGLMTSPLLKTEWPAIFRDDSLETYISPHYRKIETSVNFTLRVRDHVQAQMVVSAIKARIDQTVFNTIHDVKYNYNLPPTAMFILFDVYRRRSNVDGYNDSMAAWFKECFTNNYRITTAQNGDGATVTLADGQIRIHGWFDGDPQVPRAETSSDKEGPMLIEFSYKFWYDRPESLVINYPYVVHQQLPDPKLIDTERPNWVDNVAARRSWFEEVLHDFSNYYGQENSWLINPGIPVPFFDDWLIPNGLEIPYHMNMFRFITTLDYVNGDYRSLMNLVDELKDFEIWEEAIAYLKATGSKVNKPYHNAFSIQLYEGDFLRDMKELTLDSDLNLSYNEDLLLRANYHVTMSFCYDPSLLKKEAIEDLANHWCFGYKYFKMIWPNIIKKFPEPDSTCMTSIQNVYDVIEEMGKELDLVSPPPIPKIPTVGSFFIKAMRRK